MVLQTSGAISANNIQKEFGGIDPISLSEYYIGASPALVPNGTANSSGGLIPTFADNRPPISLAMFYGTSNKSYKCFFELTPGNLLNYSTARIPGVIDNNNNVYYSYSENEFSTPSKFQYIMKNNLFGSTASFSDSTPWKKQYGSVGYAQLNLTGAAINNTGSNIFYGGNQVGGNPFLYSISTLTGSKAWEITFTSSNTKDSDIQITAVHFDTFSNNVIVAGKNTWARTTNILYRNTFVKSYDTSNGAITGTIDRKTLVSGSTDSIIFINSIDATSDAVYTFGLYKNKPVLFRYTKSNQTDPWIKSITGGTNSTDYDLDFCLAQKTGTNIYVGVSDSTGGVKTEYLNKFDLVGNRTDVWNFTNSLGYYVTLQHACINNTNDDYYVIGDLRGILPDTNYSSVFIIKYNSSDVQQWQRSITIPNNSCIAKSVWLAPDGNTVYVNFTYGGQQAVAKLPTDGTETGKYTLTADSTIIWYNECNFIRKYTSVALTISDIPPLNVVQNPANISTNRTNDITERSSGADVTQINAGNVYTYANTIPVSITDHNLYVYAGPITQNQSAGSAKAELVFNASGNTSWTGNTTNSISGRSIELDNVVKSTGSSASGNIPGEWLKSAFKTGGAGANYQIYANNIINSPGNITLTNLTLNTWTTMNPNIGNIGFTLNSGSRNDTNAVWEVRIRDLATKTILDSGLISLEAFSAGTA